VKLLAGVALVFGAGDGTRTRDLELGKQIRRYGKLSKTRDLTTARDEHTATLLPNGKVLIAGGSNGAHESNDRGWGKTK
jgi:hypothetical protein